jgi:anti-anti-sigma factor
VTTDLSFRIAREDEGAPVVRVHGELDAFTSPALEEALRSFTGSPPLVDLRGCPFVDSHGLTALVGAARRARLRGATLVVVCDDPAVRRVFEVTGLTGLFDLVAGPASANAGVSADRGPEEAPAAR